jgi:hypothetical protein
MHLNYVTNNWYKKISLRNGSLVVPKSFLKIMRLLKSCSHDIFTKIKIRHLLRLFKKSLISCPQLHII